MGSLTTRNSYGLKGYLGLSQVSGDEWGLEATASSLPADSADQPERYDSDLYRLI